MKRLQPMTPPTDRAGTLHVTRQSVECHVGDTCEALPSGQRHQTRGGEAPPSVGVEDVTDRVTRSGFFPVALMDSPCSLHAHKYLTPRWPKMDEGRPGPEQR